MDQLQISGGFPLLSLLIFLPLAGGLAARFGCRRTILAAGTVICLCLPALMLAPSMPVLATTWSSSTPATATTP